MVKISFIEDPVGKYISQIYRKGNAFFSKKFEKYSIGSGQFMFLANLYRNNGLNQEELAEILNIDKGTTARAIKKLEEEGFIKREKDENDKRAYKLYVTQKAENIKEEIFEILREWEEILLCDLSEEEVIIIKSLLKKISNSKCIR